MWILLTWLGCTATDPAEDPEPAGPVADPEPTAPAAVGSTACRECHAPEYAAWEGSHHALAERELGEADTWARELGGVRLIGVDPVVQALIPGERGRLQAHQEAFDPRDGSRFDIFGDGRQPGEWGHWTGGGMTWNSRCAACHDTQVRKGWDGDTYTTTYSELGVGCEACHGDADAHAAGGAPPENPRMEDTCAACHSRRAELTGTFAPGDRYLDHFLPTLLDDERVFAATGRALDEAFELNQFWASPMHGGGARCGDCHDPHSGALLHGGDTLCNRCHTALGTRPHGEGPCVDCHMPTNRLMARHDRRDHGFARSEAASAAFDRARTGQGWRELDLGVAPRGLRASHVAALSRYPEDPQARGAMRRALQDGDPLVRMAAANSLLPFEPVDVDALRGAASDPIRAVRVAAQRSLATADLDWSEARDYRAYLEHNSDDPAALAERGTVRVRQGDPGGLEDLRRATELDPGDPQWAMIRAAGLTSAARPARAVAVLEPQLAAHPENAELLETYGLALVAVAREPEAIDALTRATSLESDRPRAWRNLALLHERAGDIPSAKAAAERAVALHPDPELERWAAGL